MSSTIDDLKANTFMSTTLQYIHDEEYRLVRRLEMLDEQARPYKAEVASEMVQLAQELAQLYWTESVLSQVYENDLPLLPRKAKNASEIRDRLASGEKAKDLAEEYGVSESMISRYRHGTRGTK